MATDTIPAIDTTVRQKTGTRHTQRLRETGQVPAVIYGHGEGSVAVAVNGKRLYEILHDNTHLIDVRIEGQTDHCLVKDVQWNHLGTHIIHVDLTRVDLDEKVEVSVAIELTGEAVGLKAEGAYLDHPTAEIEVACLATNIPDHITVEVSELEVGDSISVSDITLPEGVEAVSDPDTVVAAVHIAAIEEEEEPAEVEEGAEPEVIGAKKDEGEEGEAEEAEEK